MIGSDFLAKEAFYEVGNISIEKRLVDKNKLYKDGRLVKILIPNILVGNEDKVVR